jgi:hypothetical protein
MEAVEINAAKRTSRARRVLTGDEQGGEQIRELCWRCMSMFSLK